MGKYLAVTHDLSGTKPHIYGLRVLVNLTPGSRSFKLNGCTSNGSLHSRFSPNYSSRSAVHGSTRDARNAGP